MGVSFKVSKIGKRYVPKPIAEQVECSPSENPHAINGPASKKKADITETANDLVGSKASELSEHDVSFTLNLLPNGYFVGKPSEVGNFQPLLQDVKSLHPYDRASKPLFSAIETGWLPGDILDDVPCKYINGSVICEVRDYRKCALEQGTIALIDAVPVVNRIRLRMSLENVVKDIPLIADDSWTYSDLLEAESRILKALQPKLDLSPTPMLDRLCADPTIIKLNVDVGRKKRLRPATEVTITSNNQPHGKKICIDGAPEVANSEGDSGTVSSNLAMQQAHENATTQPGVISSSRSNNPFHEAARPTLTVPGHTKFQSAVNQAGVIQDHGLSPANYGVSASISLPQNMVGSYTDTANANFSLPGRREPQSSQSTSMPGLKRPRQNAAGLDGISTQQVAAPLGGFSGQDMQWKNQTMHPQIDAKGFQYSNVGVPRFSQMNQEAVTSIYFNQQVMRYGPKEEQIDSDKLDKQDLERSKDSLQAMTTDNSLDQHQLRAQHQAHQSSMRSHLPPLTQWNNPRLPVEKDMRKEDVLQKRKTLPSPRVSSGPLVQSPMSSKSGEISSGSVGGQYSAMAATSAQTSQLDKVPTNSNNAVGAPSVVSSPSDSVHRQPQVSAPLKRKANSVPKTQVMSGVGSPASVSNFNTPLNASSPSIGTSSMVDQVLMERFAKIEMATQRYQKNARKNKVENYPARKPRAYSNQQVEVSLSNSLNSEDFTDPTDTLSRSIRGGNINTCKTRLVTFIRAERLYPVVPGRTTSRLIMSEKPFDGTVAMQYGDSDDSDLPSPVDCWQTLPTTHFADLLAAQFCALMDRDGHHKADDQLFQARTSPVRMGVASGGQSIVPGLSTENLPSEGKHADSVPASLPAAVAPNNGGMGPMNSHNLSSNAGMMASGSGAQSLPISQGYLSGTGIPARNQQLEQQQLQQQHLQQLQNPQSQLQQQQQLPLPHIQRSSQVLSNNPLSHLIGQSSNIQMGSNSIGNNKSAHIQLQMQQQQHQQQQQQQQQHNQIPRKVMMGLGAAMGMGNMGNNMVGIPGLGNVIGMGGVRGLSSPMGSLPGLGTVNPNQMLPTSASNFGNGIRPASMSPAQAAAAIATKFRMAAQQNRGMYGPQPGIANLTGYNNQMLPTSAGLSMLSHALNRTNMNTLQPNATMASMGPPKISGPNFYLNPQQLQLQQQRFQQQQQQQQQLQQQQMQQHSPQMQQQQISSPLQQSQVTSPSVAGSPSPLVMQQQQQQISPQQMGQQTPMSPQQYNSAALQQINNASLGAAPPASPQLSSQTHGSIGSITSSPMEQLQGANKGGSSNI
ncbi:hypothetical protein KFK09_013495 [Dendrobium nobile]|uniref:Uncharacterized protein n=1 Tax=Dendrobium nobile TaxID=94219 RepID=A0A8T3B9S8_DENNO|nr:hypothetical protein KFK09_013495 [Dendrobium nobile]